MRMSTAFPSKYVSAGDLNGCACVLTIARVAQEMIEPSKSLPVVYFYGTQKGLVLNKTNANAIVFLHSDESDSWIGKQIEVYPTTTEFQGKIVDCIRVRGPGQVPVPPVQGYTGLPPAAQTVPGHEAPLQGNPAPPAPTARDDLDDDIPF